MKYSFFSEFSFWEHLSIQEREFFLSNLHEACYPAGSPVRSHNDSCLGTIFVKRGTLRIYLLSQQGKEATLYRIRQGEICTLSASCILSSITFDVQIDAETDCELLILPASVMSSLMKTNIYIENFIYKITSEHFSDVVSAIERMFFMTLKQRVAAFLIDESSQLNSNELTLTQEQLAKNIGSAREAVSRILKQFVQEGSILISRKGITLLDKARLYAELES